MIEKKSLDYEKTILVGIVDSNQNNDLTDEITTNDDANYRIMSVTSQKSGISIVNLIALTPIGNTQITLTFHTLRR